jgi:glycosyltransferase involved in cell wall biosynthesis
MKITILSHSLTSNAAMRAHRLGLAARHFADVTLIGPVKHRGAWGALPQEPWIKPVAAKNLPKFYKSALEMIAACEGDLLLAVKPYLASYGVALVAGDCRKVPVILDIDDLDLQLAPKTQRTIGQAMEELRDPASTTYLRILSHATSAASTITVASSRLQTRFGGTLVPHGCPVEQFNPDSIDRDKARRHFGFSGPVAVFPGTRRTHKGLKPLAKAVARIPGARLAVLSRPEDYTETEWQGAPLLRLPIIPYAELPELLAAADVVAVPQLAGEAADHQMPMKVYDAMAMGKPIVASTASDLPQTLQDCARLVPPGDVAALAEAIQDLLSDTATARALGERARKRCLENYTMRHVADRLLEAVHRARNEDGATRSESSKIS